MNAPAQAGLAALQLKDPKLFREQCYVDGGWADADSRKTIPVNNPATGEVLGSVPRMGSQEAKRAVEAAERAWPAWRAKTAKKRAARSPTAPHSSSGSPRKASAPTAT